MAGCSSSYYALILLVTIFMAMTNHPTLISLSSSAAVAAACGVAPCEREINLSYYMHQVVTGPTHNQEVAVSSPYPQGFGTIAVQDWTIVSGPEPGATVVGRAKGIHVQADQANNGWYTCITIVFNTGRFQGSSFQVMGINGAQGQLAIIGGTGQFATARGTIDYNVTKSVANVESYRSIDIHAYILQPAAISSTAADDKAIIL